jgi:hypothetical protein
MMDADFGEHTGRSQVLLDIRPVNGHLGDQGANANRACTALWLRQLDAMSKAASPI